MADLAIKYIFQLVDGPRHELGVRLDPRTLLDLSKPNGALPDWTRLGFQQCPNCPLSAEQHPHCPAAVQILDVVEAFGELTSIDEARVRVEVQSRTYSKEVPLAAGIASLVGLKMATSGCPVVAKLRPMARFHLPFATEEDTLFRALATYLIAQVLRERVGKSVDFSLAGLKDAYAQITVVNRAFATRLRAALNQDAGANALVRLDLFAKAVPLDLGDFLERLVPAFGAWE